MYLRYKMAAVGDSGEVTLTVPWEVLDAGPGIAIDIGGSVVKVLYIHKDEYVKPENRKQSCNGQLRLVNFAKERLDEAFEFMKKNAFIKRSHPEETVKIYTTGIGGSQFGKRIKSELNVKSENIAETDCFIQAFTYLLKTVSRKNILCEIDSTIFEKAKKKNLEILEMLKKFSTMTDTMQNLEIKTEDLSYAQESYMTEDKPLHEQQGLYPCMLMLCGSGIGGMLVKEDGSCMAGTMLPLGGRMFLGLGCLLTKSKTFEELMDLCEKGNAAKVAITNVHLSQGWDQSEEQSVYSGMSDLEETMVYFFGQAVGKSPDDFKREDLARCLLEYFVRDLVSSTHIACREQGASSVFFTGGFANHPLIQRLVTQEWLGIDGQMANLEMKEGTRDNKKKAVHFLKHGSHLGALGAYLNSKLHFAGQHG